MSDFYIFGASTNGQAAHEICKQHGVNVVGFIDNYSTQKYHCGLPIHRPHSIPKDSKILITSPHYCYEVQFQLRRLGFVCIVGLSTFFKNLGIEPEKSWFADYQQNKKEYDWLRKNLADANSELVLDGILKYRETFDLFYTAAICKRGAKQWFDFEIWKPKQDEVYVDGGAYDGDTAGDFIIRNKYYREIHLFEPDEAASNKSKERLREEPSIHYHNVGLSDKKEKGFMENAGTPSGRIEGNTGVPVVCDTIDNLVNAPVTFLKLDVEGFEEKALMGASRQIRENHPFITAAVYHKASDLWKIPQVISSMMNYKFYLRHYTQFYHETVLYCV